MLSARTLERVSVEYRNGYYDGYDGKVNKYVEKPELLRPFGEHDYTEGYKAGANDKFWELKHQDLLKERNAAASKIDFGGRS